MDSTKEELIAATGIRGTLAIMIAQEGDKYVARNPRDGWEGEQLVKDAPPHGRALAEYLFPAELVVAARANDAGDCTACVVRV